MDRRAPSSIFLSRCLLALSIATMAGFAFILITPLQSAHAAPFIATSVKVASNANASLGYLNWSFNGFTPFSCYLNGYWWVIYPASGGNGVLRYVYSTDTVTWSTDALFFTPQNIVSFKGYSIACDTLATGSTGSAVIGVAYTDFGTSPYTFYNEVIFTTPTAFTLEFANDKGVTGTPGGVALTNPPPMVFDSSGAQVISSIKQSTGADVFNYLNGAETVDIAITAIGTGYYYPLWNPVNSISSVNSLIYASPASANYVPNIFYGGVLHPMSGTTTHNTVGGPTILSTYKSVNGATFLFPYSQGTGSNNGQCSIETYNTVSGVFTNQVVTGQSAVCGYNSVANVIPEQWAVSDSSGQNIWLIYGNQQSAINQIVYSSDNGNTYAVAGYSPGGADTVGFNGIYFNSAANAFQGLAVETDSAGGIWTQLFSTSSSTGSTQTQTIGQCPTKDTATTKLTNNTLLYYTATIVGTSETINTASTFVATTFSSGAAPFTIFTAVYVTPSVGAVSVSNPLNLASSHSFSVSPNSVNQALNYAVAIAPLTTGQTVAIAVLGSDKFTLNQSTLAGMNKVTTSGLTLPGSITSTTGASQQLYLCAIATYQSSITSTTTKTLTGSSFTTITNTNTVLVTSTTTATSLDINTAVSVSSGFTLLFLVILLPAIALGVPAAIYTHSGPVTGMSFAGGLGIGAGLGNAAGIVPLFVLAILVIVMVLLILGSLLAMRGG